jgi:hypothetical protein
LGSSVDDPHLTAIMLFQALHGAVDDVIVAKSKVNRNRLVGKSEAFAHRVVGLA